MSETDYQSLSPLDQTAVLKIIRSQSFKNFKRKRSSRFILKSFRKIILFPSHHLKGRLVLNLNGIQTITYTEKQWYFPIVYTGQ